MKWRIWLLSLGITLLCVLIFGFASTQVYYRSSVDDGKRFLHACMNSFDADEYPPTTEGAKAFSDKLDGARVTFMDMQGNVLADSIAGDSAVNHLDRSEVTDAIRDGDGYAVRDSSTLGADMVYYCRSIDGMLVRLAVFTQSDWSIFASTLPTLLAFSSVMIVLCLAASFIATHFIIGPVKKLAAEAAQSETVTTRYSELAPVADALNARNRDIHRQMRELTAEKTAVEQARASKDEFISNVTHEMNTPLTSIHGYAELLDGGGMTEAQKKTAYKTILSQSERLTNLIACIINFSEIENDNLPPYDVDFSAIVRETLVVVSPEAQKRNIAIDGNIADNVIISSRHERLNELFGNLIRNAIKYNKDGGKINVTLDNRSLTVEDTGIGIAEENMNKIFSRFFTVDKSHSGKNGGFGLGLAVVKKICAKSGWEISVEREPDRGSKFTVDFAPQQR